MLTSVSSAAHFFSQMTAVDLDASGLSHVSQENLETLQCGQIIPWGFNFWDAISRQFGTRNHATYLAAQSTALFKCLNIGNIQNVLIWLNGWILLYLIYAVSSVVCEIGPINPVSQDWGQVEVVVRGDKRGTSSIYFTYRVNSHIHAQKNVLSLPLSRRWNSSMQAYLDPQNKHKRFQLILFWFCKFGEMFPFPQLPAVSQQHQGHVISVILPMQHPTCW